MSKPDTPLRALAAGVWQTRVHFQWPPLKPEDERGNAKDMRKARIILAMLRARGWVLTRKEAKP